MNEPTRTPEPDRPAPDVRDLYPVLGSLLELLAEEVPQAVSMCRTWDIGAMPDGTPGIRGGVLTDDAMGSVLARIAGLLGGETSVHSGSAYATSGGMKRLHTLHAHWHGNAVRITVARPEPTEREALLARLAELDAAKGGEQR